MGSASTDGQTWLDPKNQRDGKVVSPADKDGSHSIVSAARPFYWWSQQDIQGKMSSTTGDNDGHNLHPWLLSQTSLERVGRKKSIQHVYTLWPGQKTRILSPGKKTELFDTISWTAQICKRAHAQAGPNKLERDGDGLGWEFYREKGGIVLYTSQVSRVGSIIQIYNTRSQLAKVSVSRGRPSRKKGQLIRTVGWMDSGDGSSHVWNCTCTTWAGFLGRVGGKSWLMKWLRTSQPMSGRLS